MKGLFIFAAGLAVGAVAGAYLIKDKVMADAKQEIDEVREYYRSKKGKVEDADEPQEVDKEAVLHEATEVIKEKYEEKYEEIARTYTNYNKTTTPVTKVVNDMPYTIDVEEFGELDDYPTATYTYFADGVLVDDVDDVVDDPDPIIGLENLRIFEEFPDCTSIFVRNDIWRMDFEVLRDDWNWSDCQDVTESEAKILDNKKPHQL